MALYSRFGVETFHIRPEEDASIGAALLDDWERRSSVVRQNFLQLVSDVDSCGVGDWCGLSKLIVATSTFQDVALCFFGERPYIAVDQATYILWHDAASAQTHDDKREYQQVITSTMQSLFRTPLRTNDDHVKMAQLFAGLPEVNDEASTVGDLGDDVENTEKTKTEATTVFEEACDEATAVVVNSTETTCEADSQSASDAMKEGEKISAPTRTSVDSGLNEDYVSGGRFIPRTDYLVELISEALETQWVRKTDEFRAFMHEISEDSPKRWATSDGITSLIRKLENILTFHGAINRYTRRTFFVNAEVFELAMWTEFVLKVALGDDALGPFLHTVFAEFYVTCVLPLVDGE